MTTGRSNSVASETRNSVSWNVERAPNKGRNCLGCTSREAGQSRVPAPPHMISGIIRRFIGASNLVVVAIPGDKIAKTILNRGLGPEARIAHQVGDIGEGLGHIAGLHRQHLRNFYHMTELFRMIIADIVNAGRDAAGETDVIG